jgi:hypothetical protein
VEAFIGQPPDAVHAAWHWWSPGQHEGCAAGQSEFDRHAPHRPIATTQSGVGCEQPPLLVQSTQPSVGLHCWPP